MSVATVNSADTVLRITRVFDASPERVFNAWLEPAQMAKWMGPRMFVERCDIEQSDRRVGGKYRLRMVKPAAPDRKPDSVVGGVYREISPFTKLVFTWNWDANANCGSAQAHVPQPHEDGVDTLITLTFKRVGTKTEMTLLHEHFPNAERRDSHNQGWSGSFDQLEVALKNGQI